MYFDTPGARLIKMLWKRGKIKIYLLYIVPCGFGSQTLAHKIFHEFNFRISPNFPSHKTLGSYKTVAFRDTWSKIDASGCSEYYINYASMY